MMDESTLAQIRMMDESTLAQIRTELAQHRARRAVLLDDLEKVTDQIRPLALALIADGRSEVEVAREAGVDRMTVRSWQGKPRTKKTA